MDIVRYTPEIQALLKSKTKPEPWLHCGIYDGNYVIWVWDTRDVVESGTSDAAWSFKLPKSRQYANDNHVPLHGNVPSYMQKYSSMQYWPAEAVAKAEGIHFPSEAESEDQIGKWQFQGSTFFGNNAFFASHAKRIATWYHKNPAKNFNALVTKLLIAMQSHFGTYTGMSRGKSVPGPTFNDILFSIDSNATRLARKIMQAR